MRIRTPILFSIVVAFAASSSIGNGASRDARRSHDFQVFLPATQALENLKTKITWTISPQ